MTPRIVRARDDGVVAWASRGPIGFPGMLDGVLGLCYMQTCDSTPGENLRYGHLSELWVSVGQRVVRGQEIGRTGATGLPGYITGPHLHEERVVGDRRLDPTVYDPLVWP